ncbi:MAG: Sec-independent protein translocase subunit TatA/TatB [Terriglobales bacterium]
MSFGELLFLLILALLVFGPRKLPEIARTAAKLMTDLRRASNEFRYTLEEEIRNIEVTERPGPEPAPAPEAVEGAVARDADPLPEAGELALLPAEIAEGEYTRGDVQEGVGLAGVQAAAAGAASARHP